MARPVSAKRHCEGGRLLLRRWALAAEESCIWRIIGDFCRVCLCRKSGLTHRGSSLNVLCATAGC